MVIKRIGVLKAGVFQGCLLALFGLLIGAFFALFGSLAGSLFPEASWHGAGAVIGIAALIFIPVFYGVFGFIAGVIGAALYNLVAGIVGGIEIDVA